MKHKICILGSENNWNTKFLVLEMHKLGIEFSLALERQNIPFDGNIYKFFKNRTTKFIKKFSNGHLKALSSKTFFYWKKIACRLLFNRSRNFKLLTSDYDDESLNNVLRNTSVKYFNHINDSEAHKFFKNSEFDIGVLGGIGILSKQTINCFKKFCINAHPGPLPQCRGGGALQNTLSQGFQPSASIHLVTPEIDAGDILKVVPMNLASSDNIFTVGLKLCIHCSQELALVIFEIMSGKEFIKTSNNGKLYFWKDCNIDIQKKAEKNLKLLLAKLP
jgi:methionyl-tRNA formyltransferase